ncbi:hypothetical protein [Thalassospira marina]|uniref:Uncharacterized protein n=1 Tax=Thalassospira marina TaxID=2048283 RepID=A0A2N3KXX4_9PROT|nr:hypothetical protein [Thalassospira marina]PKR55425.1 hypothetical protein COO20_04440 [Thalassospira marina]
MTLTPIEEIELDRNIEIDRLRKAKSSKNSQAVGRHLAEMRRLTLASLKLSNEQGRVGRAAQ